MQFPTVFEENFFENLKLGPSAAAFLCPECTKTRLRASQILKFFPGAIPPDPRYKGEGRGGGRGREWMDPLIF